MAGLNWNTGKLYYSTVELGYQQLINDSVGPSIFFVCCFLVSLIMIHRADHGINILNVEFNWVPKEFSCAVSTERGFFPF